MATKKDLVEAHAFSRRRLVTAFLSGAPGGREVEPTKPGRAIIGGIALSVLLVAGGAIASVLAARTPADWRQPGLVVARENNAAYVILSDSPHPVLLPIANITSAQLIFGADVRSVSVAASDIDAETPGQTIGIFNAPPPLPQTDDLVESGWTACTDDALGMKVSVRSTPQVSSGRDNGFVVQTEQGAFLVATGADDGRGERARYFALPDDAVGVDQMLDELGVTSTADAMRVPGDWLRLFEEGGELSFDSFGFDPAGPLPADLRGVPDLAVGDYVLDPGADGAVGAGGRVVTPEGLLPLDPFALTVYRNSVVPGTNRAPREVPGADLTAGDFAGVDALTRAGWPRDLVTGGTPPGQACAVLVAAAGQRPAVRLGVDPVGAASAAEVDDPTQRVVEVEPGRGAFVYIGSFADETTTGSPAVVNSQANIYPLLDAQTVGKLGYASVEAPVVPDTWTRLFDVGVTLSTSAALCPPDPSGGAAVGVDCESLGGDDDADAEAGGAG